MPTFHSLPRRPSPRAILVLVLLLPLLLCGCSKAPYVWASEVPAERARPETLSETINLGDTIGVSVAGQPQLSGQLVVAADGTVSLPEAGAVSVVNLTAAQAATALSGALQRLIQTPQVSVALTLQRIDVSVLGEVRAPGQYQLNTGDGVVALIARAGGLGEFANGDAIYLVRSSEPKRIRFRMRDLLRGGSSATAFALRDGDLIIVE